MARPKSYPPDLRERLIETAADRLAAGGAEALSLRELAASQGTSTNAVYSIFGSKPELIKAVIESAAAGFAAAQREVIEDGADVATLADLGRAYRRWALAHRSLYLVMFAADPSGEIRRPGLEGTVPLRAALARLMGAGDLAEVDVALAARSLWASVHGWVMLEIADRAEPDPADDAAFDRHLEVSLYGLATEQLRDAATR